MARNTEKTKAQSAKRAVVPIVVGLLKPRTTPTYDDWVNGLRDGVVRSRILVRVDRLCAGNPGIHRNLTDGVSELVLDFGPGYRVYYTKRGLEIVVLLAGGTKPTQNSDIAKAIELAKNL
jgi:putative addiction module killer protein